MRVKDRAGWAQQTASVLSSCSLTQSSSAQMRAKGQDRAQAQAVTRISPSGPSPWGVDEGVVKTNPSHQGSGYGGVQGLSKHPSPLGARLEAATLPWGHGHRLHVHSPGTLASLAAYRNQEVVSGASSRIQTKNPDQTMCPLIKPGVPYKLIIQVIVMGRRLPLYGGPHSGALWLGVRLQLYYSWAMCPGEVA